MMHEELNAPKTWLMWVDGVGGYLVCCGEEVALGPPQSGADVPIRGEISHRHATLRRAEERWWIEPHRAVLLDGQAVTAAAVLPTDCVIQLGASIQLRYRQPHPLSRSARLDFVSRHKTEPAVEGVILMGENVILGPQSQNHVVCRSWTHELVIFRQGDKLFCRSKLPYEVDGRACEGKSEIEYNVQLTGADWAVRLEPVA